MSDRRNGELTVVNAIPLYIQLRDGRLDGGHWITRDSYEWADLAAQFPTAAEQYDAALVFLSTSERYAYSRAYFITGIIPYLSKLCAVYYGDLGQPRFAKGEQP